MDRDGTAVPALAALDHAMQAFMKENGVRAAQLAVGKNGAIEVLARLHVGRARISRDSAVGSVPARELQQDVPGSGRADRSTTHRS